VLKKLLAITAIVASLLFTPVSAAFAQTGDAQPDGNGHPNVGAFLVRRPPERGGYLRIICSGTLVTPRLFLTASHCTAFAIALGQGNDVYVTFDPNFGRPTNVFSTPYHGVVKHNPAYKAPYQYDVSAILLDEPVAGITPATLAPLGFLDGLRVAGTIKTTEYLNVGYGSSEQEIATGAEGGPVVGPVFPFDGVRKWTISGFYALDRRFIHLNQNLAQGYSGTGYGDSGGPTFVTTATGPVVISVVSTGDVPLYATSVNTRVDTQSARDFLAPLLALN